MNNDTLIDDDQYCQPAYGANVSDTCAYVQETDACGGGGYLAWTVFVYCCEDPVAKWFIVAGGALFLLLLFLMITISADDFLCPNVSTIVSKLNISENMAGVTFMAFGNGAPDVFSSIASVVSSPLPRADLALGTLLGGTMFVTLLVTSTIIVTRPFKAARWSSLRDLIFFIITMGLILLFFLYSNEVQLWMPLTFLGIYVLYVITVFSIEIYKKRQWRIKAEKEATEVKEEPVSNGNGISSKRTSIAASRRGSTRVAVHVSGIFGGHDIVVEHHTEDEDSEAFIARNLARHSMRRSRNATRLSIAASVRPVSGVRGVIASLIAYFAIDFEEDEPTMFERIKVYTLYPIGFLFRLTVPLAELQWSKPMAIIHAIISPQCFLFNIKMTFLSPIEGGPGLWAYVPVISILIIAFILITTKMDEEPRFYKFVYSLCGFIMSIGWMYCISAEIVDVITMIGVVTGIDQAILGLTVIAWSNSVGDLIADVSIAKQGFCRMAMAASIGGPLFNILIGFGLPFTIAKLKGTPVPIAFNSVSLIMVVFMFIGLLSISVILLAFRANLKRFHGYILICIYVAFLTFILLAATNVLQWIS